MWLYTPAPHDNSTRNYLLSNQPTLREQEDPIIVDDVGKVSY